MTLLRRLLLFSPPAAVDPFPVGTSKEYTTTGTFTVLSTGTYRISARSAAGTGGNGAGGVGGGGGGGGAFAQGDFTLTAAQSLLIELDSTPANAGESGSIIGVNVTIDGDGGTQLLVTIENGENGFDGDRGKAPGNGGLGGGRTAAPIVSGTKLVGGTNITKLGGDGGGSSTNKGSTGGATATSSGNGAAGTSDTVIAAPSASTTGGGSGGPDGSSGATGLVCLVTIERTA